MENIYQFGAKKPKIDLRDYKLVASANATFPSRFELPNPTIKNQGNTQTCVGHALSSVIEFYNNKQEGNNDLFSPYFIYGYRPDDYYQGYGMYLSDALKTVQNIGAVKVKDFEYSGDLPTIKTMVDSNINTLKDKAYPNRITSYYSCSDANCIKTTLTSGSYVVTVIPVYDDFYYDTNYIITSKMKTISGYHCVIIRGWNDDFGYWIVDNSWGEQWGNKGDFYLPYNYPIADARGITDDIINCNTIIIKPPTWLDGILKFINIIINLFRK